MLAPSALMAATILACWRSRSSASAAPRGPSGVQVLSVTGSARAVVVEGAAAAGGDEVHAGGVEVVQHVERREAQVAAHVLRGRGAGVDEGGRRGAVVGDPGGRLELPDVVAELQHDRRVEGRRGADADRVRRGQPRQRGALVRGGEEVQAGPVVEGDRARGVVGLDGVDGRACRRVATSVGWISGLVPAARPISAYWLVEKVLVTVNAPVGASSSPSCDLAARPRWPGARWRAGTGAAARPSDVTSSGGAGLSWVRAGELLTWPVTSTWSPILARREPRSRRRRSRRRRPLGGRRRRGSACRSR